MSLPKFPLWQVSFLVLLLLSIPAQAFVSSTDESAVIKATVVGFSKGQSNLDFITLRVEQIVSYDRAKNSTNIPLSQNQTLVLGFLWGNRTVNSSFPQLIAGDVILGHIDYHYNFTTHTGHLYSYELICKAGEQKVEGLCRPTACADDEVLVNYNCIRLECDDDEQPLNHRCVGLNCTSIQKAAGHRCVEVECKDSEYAIDHGCASLTCKSGEGARNHACFQLFCGLFKKPSNHACVSDPLQILIFSFALVFLLSLFYELTLKRVLENKTRRERFLKSRLFLVLLFMLVLVVISVPLAFRYLSYGTLLIGDTPYHHANIARDIIEGKVNYTPFAQGLHLYHLLLAYLGASFGLEAVSMVLPPIIGAVILTLFYVLLRRLLNDSKLALFAALLLLFSPPFFYLSLISSPDLLILPGLLFALLLIVSEKRSSIFFGWILFLLISLSNPFVFLSSVLLFLIASIYLRNENMLRKVLLIMLVVAGVGYHLLTFNAAPQLYSFRGNLLGASITDLGGLAGFGIFYIVLAAAGLLSSWGRKRAFYPLHLALIILFIAMVILNQDYNVYLNFLLAYLAALGLMALLSRKWETGFLKTLTIIVIICGLLFSTLAYAKRLSSLEPDVPQAEGLSWLSGQEKGKVLSYPGYSEWIKYFARHTPLLDEASPGLLRQFNLTEEIFYSRNLVRTSSLLTANDIRYILITDKMRLGLVWNRENQGLLFLFRNNETFRKIYGTPELEVWEYLPK
jgi:hypothetical protein